MKIFSYFVIFRFTKRSLCSAATGNASLRGKQKRERQMCAVTICQEIFEWTVYLPFGNDDTIWALLTVSLASDLLSVKTTPSSDIPQPRTTALHRHFYHHPRRFSSSSPSPISSSPPFSSSNLVFFPFLRFRDGTSCRTGIPSDTQNGWLENFIS